MLTAIYSAYRRDYFMFTRSYGLFLRNSSALVSLLVVLTVVSCGQGNKRELAEQGVAQFHAQLNSEQYHAIYVGADDKFHQASTEADFVAFMEAVHRKLGNAGQSSLQNTQIAWFAGQGTFVTLSYNTQFAEAKAGEKFTWLVRGDSPVLVGYNITSNALITK
jgi:Protein of unknown function (DUF4019)